MNPEEIFAEFLFLFSDKFLEVHGEILKNIPVRLLGAISGGNFMGIFG